MRCRAAAAAALGLLTATPAPAHDAHAPDAHAQNGNAQQVASAARAFATPQPGTYALPPLGAAADGQVLTDAGQTVRLHELFGPDVVVLSFIYTQCSDAEGCPFATAVLHAIGARLVEEPELLGRVRMISLSFDPARDTPAVMRRYGEGVRREGIDWRFLTTASEEELSPILDAYRQTRVAERDEQGQATGQYAHLLRVFLIDRERQIRQVYSTSLLQADTLVSDIQTLLIETDSPRPTLRTALDAPEPAALRGSGDIRAGYERSDYATRSLPLAARRGSEADLLARARRPVLGLPALPIPPDNPLSADKVALGRQLFFDRRLSRNDTLSCALCHVPEQGFTSNELATPVGIEGRTVRRNAPTLYNSAYVDQLFHDGRSPSLEAQIWGPLLAPNEMGHASRAAVVEKLRAIDDYAAPFRAAFPGRGLDEGTLAQAIASYERTLVSGDSPFDRFRFADDEDALGPAQRRGLELFTGRAGCAACHTIGTEHATFSDGRFHNTGIGTAANAADDDAKIRVQAAPGVYLEVPRAIVARVGDPPASDLGRFEVTGDPADRARYRTPGLRNVALTAPYMHDGSLPTLEAVVDFYRRGGQPNAGLDPLVRPLDLRDDEAADLVAFLEALTGADVDALVADSFAAPVGDR